MAKQEAKLAGVAGVVAPGESDQERCDREVLERVEKAEREVRELGDEYRDMLKSHNERIRELRLELIAKEGDLRTAKERLQPLLGERQEIFDRRSRRKAAAAREAELRARGIKAPGVAAVAGVAGGVEVPGVVAVG